MLNHLPIIPFSHPPLANLQLPGSKSITNRTLILAALTTDLVEIQNASICEDTLIMVDALKALGFSISINKTSSTISIQGLGSKIPNNQANIYAGNAGTAARFLPALLCLNPSGLYYLDASPTMRKRPMKPLLDALESLGAATIFYHETIGHFPFTIKTHGMQSGSIVIDNNLTSQVLSALLMIAPFTPSALNIKFTSKTLSWPFVEMTLKMMQAFCPYPLPHIENNEFHFTPTGPYSLADKKYFVEPDATAASYFLALVLILGGQINFPNLSLNTSFQGDLAFANILHSQGLSYEESSNGLFVQRSSSANLTGLSHNFETFSDTFLTLAAIAPLLKGPTHISGIAHTRFQECDRLSAVATQLKKLNQTVIQKEDSLTIIPRPLKPTTIETYDDHRIAMSFAVLGSYDLLKSGTPWLSIANPSCCSKTFPSFFETLNNLRNSYNTYSSSCITEISQ